VVIVSGMGAGASAGGLLDCDLAICTNELARATGPPLSHSVLVIAKGKNTNG
jgi:hypothetical protein